MFHIVRTTGIVSAQLAIFEIKCFFQGQKVHFSMSSCELTSKLFIVYSGSATCKHYYMLNQAKQV